MKRPLTEPVLTLVDASRLDGIPSCSLAEMAWMAGLAEEALRRYLEEANTLAGEAGLPLPALIRAAFTLLGRKENQAAMLRQQLTSTLERERELSETLRVGLLGSGLPTAPRAPERPALPVSESSVSSLAAVKAQPAQQSSKKKKKK
ncbi:MAG: hypothetical protein HQL95_16090 [Magnetococcales bacterium]|nr:hypothetical protein [Magnetococcales bacterium]